MSKVIEFKYQDTDYCLEYNRDVIKIMEKQGFNYDKFREMPMNMYDIAFQGAFLKNHRNIRVQTINEILDNLDDKMGLLNTLMEMIQETYEDFSTNKDDGKNVKWKVS